MWWIFLNFLDVAPGELRRGKQHHLQAGEQMKSSGCCITTSLHPTTPFIMLLRTLPTLLLAATAVQGLNDASPFFLLSSEP